MNLIPTGRQVFAGDPPVSGHESAALDWQSLALRLAGAAACREVLADRRRPTVRGGSFDAAAARELAGFDRRANSALQSDEPLSASDNRYYSSPVNRIDSVEVKPGAAIRLGTAGKLMTGERGFK